MFPSDLHVSHVKDEEFEALEQKCKELEEKFNREEKLRKDTETELAKLRAEKQEVFLQLEQERDNNAESEERAAKLLAQKSDFEKQVLARNVLVGTKECCYIALSSGLELFST